jgi:flagellar basal body rod protein FlgG
MIRGIYSAASAFQVGTEQQEVTAYNLANASMPGFRARGLVSETFDQVLGRGVPPTGEVLGTKTAQVYHDFRPGALQQTGQPYDLALGDNDRFFVLGGPNGPLYTRNGTLYRTAAGQFVSQAGFPLQGETGPINFPPQTQRLTITSDGAVIADGEPIGRVRLVRFENPNQLTASGPTLYTAPAEAGLQAVPGRVLQGFREGSNVQPAEAMVRMIITSRYYDAAQRTLRTMAESLQLNTRPTG